MSSEEQRNIRSAAEALYRNPRPTHAPNRYDLREYSFAVISKTKKNLIV